MLGARADPERDDSVWPGHDGVITLGHVPGASAAHGTHEGEPLQGPGTAQPLYISEPGVVSSSPVSSHVFRPERIIGQPP
jgi:hypothetical protein